MKIQGDILSYISSIVFNNSPETVCAITGTNGKTSTTNFLQQIWNLMGLKSSSIGTLGISEMKKYKIQILLPQTPFYYIRH